MVSNFVRIKDQRIRKNTIKKYCPAGEDRINVYYSNSRYKVEVETFKFDDEDQRDDVVEMLDSLL